MKISIGHMITIAMVGFMTFILYLVYMASSTNVDLYAEDYYIQELEYGSVINAKDNSIGLEDEIQVLQDGDFTQIIFSDKIDIIKASGMVHFYKANNGDADQKFEFSPENPINAVKSSDFEKGTYLVKISWKIEDKSYFIEKVFSLV